MPAGLVTVQYTLGGVALPFGAAVRNALLGPEITRLRSSVMARSTPASALTIASCHEAL